MTRPSVAMPPAPRTLVLARSVVVKMALGEAPESIPAGIDVRHRRVPIADRMDGGVVDRIIRHFAGATRVSRVHAAAASVGRPGVRHRDFNDVEQVTGVARTFRVELPAGTPVRSLVDSLRQIVTVESAAPNYIATAPFAAGATAPDGRGQPWDLVRAAEALAYEPGDPAVIVAIVDSGVRPEHPELPPMRGGYDSVQLGRGEVAAGVKLLGDSTGVDTRPIDRYVGHGMACAGIISALGIDMPRGLAGAAQVLPMRALGAARFPGQARAIGVGSSTDIDMAVKMSVDLGGSVINMSFGTDDSALEPDSPKPHADVVNYALEHGCILVAASGNSGDDTIYWPAAFPGVIAAGAVGLDRRPCAFSTRGAHVALCAPGERVRSLGLTGYEEATGTSFAAPFVAAASALLVARARRRSTPVDVHVIRTVLQRSATPFGGGSTERCGAGVLNAAAALRALDQWIDRTLPGTPEDVEDG